MATSDDDDIMALLDAADNAITTGTVDKELQCVECGGISRIPLTRKLEVCVACYARWREFYVGQWQNGRRALGFLGPKSY